jgi:hypothetical protein
MQALVFFLSLSLSISIYSQELSLTAKARLIAGMEACSIDPLAAWVEDSHQWQRAIRQKETAHHFWTLSALKGNPNQLRHPKRAEIEDFLLKNFTQAFVNTRNVLYLFGGPDFSYPDLFFPYMENLILVGQQKVGSFPNIHKLIETNQLEKWMKNLSLILSHIPFRSYHVTNIMNCNCREFGIISILAAEIALANYRIVGYQRISLDDDGSLLRGHLPNKILGIKITYCKHDKKRHIFYFEHQLSNNLKTPFINFVKRKKIDSAFYKATSYMTQYNSELNQFVLKHAAYIVQGDSGIPLSNFDLKNWEIKLFGIYARPFKVIGAGPYWGMQTDLRDVTIALINRDGHKKMQSIVKNIWGADVYSHAVATVFPPAPLSWDGILPFTFDYGGQLVPVPFKPYSSTMQYAIKRNRH